MKRISKVLAVVLAILMLASICCGCHKKGEIAVTVGDKEYTSGMYSCMLFIASNAARATIDDYIEESNSSSSSSSTTSSESVDYSKYKFDAEGKVSLTGTYTFEKFVEKEAINLLTQYTVVLSEMEEKGLKLDDESLNSAKVQAQYYWYIGCDYSTYQYYASYGMDPTSYFTPLGPVLEELGVSYSTYEQYNIYESNYAFYFKKLYGEGGEKEIPKTDLTAYLTEHYVVADLITFQKKDSEGKDMTEQKITELKESVDAYADRINNGEEFDKIYNEYVEEQKKQNETSSSTSSTTTSSTASSTTSSTTSSTASDTTSGDKEAEYTPKSYTSLFGDDETNYGADIYEDIKKSELDKAVVVEDESSDSFVLFVKRDILKEEYWLKTLRNTICYALKSEEFDKGIDEAGKLLTVTENTYATGQFDVDDIEF